MATAPARGMPLYAGPKRQSNLKRRHFDGIFTGQPQVSTANIPQQSPPKPICWRFGAVAMSLFFTLLLQTLYV